MNDSTPSVTWWLKMVKIAWKGFEVLSKGEGQATAWRPRNLARVKKEVLAFSWGTNQTMMVTLKWRIKHIGWIVKWLDTFEVNSHSLNGIKSHAQDGYAQGENQNWLVDTLTWWWFKAMAFGLKEINSSDSTLILFDLELIQVCHTIKRDASCR